MNVDVKPPPPGIRGAWARTFGWSREIRHFNYGFFCVAVPLIVYAELRSRYLEWRGVPFLDPPDERNPGSGPP